jgi:hypothetical protein
MKIRKVMGIIGVLFGTMLVMAGVGFTKTSLVNETFAAATGNKTNATNIPSPQAVLQKGATPPVSNSSLSNDVKTTTTNNNLTLGNPFYIAYDKQPTSQVPVPLRGGGTATEVIYSGTGTVKGIRFVETGRALIIPISRTIVDIDGGLVIKANDGGGKDNGNATLSFREIGNMTAAGTLQGSGAAIFNPNATGKLSFLSNTVAIFTDNGSKDGTNIIKAWEWKYR